MKKVGITVSETNDGAEWTISVVIDPDKPGEIKDSGTTPSVASAILAASTAAIALCSSAPRPTK